MKYEPKTENEDHCYNIGYWEGYEAALENVTGHASEAGINISRRVKKLEERLAGGM